MPDKYGLDKQNDDGTFLEGVLKGQTSVSVLIGVDETKWLEHASKATGYSIGRLVEISAEEAALDHAKNNNLI